MGPTDTHRDQGLEEQPVEEASLGELVGSLSSEIGALVRAHLGLTLAEIKDEIRKASRAGTLTAVGAVLALASVIALTLAAGWGLAEVMPAGWAFLVVAGVWAIAAGLAVIARSRLRQVDPTPELTIQELKEDTRWIKAQRT